MMITPGRNKNKNENNGQEVKHTLSGDRKPRFKWTVEVHKRFVDAVNQLGGIYKATPKNIMKLMDVEQITTDHIKSHLQKYRLNGSMQANKNPRKMIRATVFQRHQEHMYSKTPGLHITGNIQVSNVPEIRTERHRSSQTKLEQLQMVQQQVQYNEHSRLEKASNNGERQYPQLEETESMTDQHDNQRTLIQKDYRSIMNCYSLIFPMKDADTTYATHEIERKNFLEPPYKRWLEAHREKGKIPYTSTRTDDMELITPEQEKFDNTPVRISLHTEKRCSTSNFSVDGTKERGKRYHVYASPTYAAQLEAQNMVDAHNLISLITSYDDLQARNASNEKPFDLNVPAKEQEE